MKHIISKGPDPDWMYTSKQASGYPPYLLPNLIHWLLNTEGLTDA